MTAAPTPPAREVPPSRLPRVSTWMLAAMAVVHFLQWTLVQPADVQAVLGFQRGDLELGRWWTALTYPFTHRDTALLLLNAYALLIFGSRLERSWGSKRFAAFVVVAGLGGWTLHLLSGSAGVLLGASSSAFAALAAYAMRWGADEHELGGGLRMRGSWLAAFVASMILLIGLRTSAGGGLGFLAHLGGIGAAWLFVRATPVLLVERLRGGVSALPDEPAADLPPRVVPKSLPRSRAREREMGDDMSSRTSATPARRAAPRRRANTEATPPPPPSIDEILDKISAQGLERLSDEERRVLDDHSRRLRDG